MTERALKFRPVLFRHVLPVIELDGLARRLGSCRRAQQEEQAGRDHRDRQQDEFSQSSHLGESSLCVNVVKLGRTSRVLRRQIIQTRWMNRKSDQWIL